MPDMFKKSDFNLIVKNIPAIFAAFVSSSFTWHFSADKTPFMFVFAVGILVQLGIFKVFDIARKPKKKYIFLVFFVSVIVLIKPIGLFYENIRLLQAYTKISDYQSFLDWFFANGSYVNYSPGFCCILFILISCVAGSAIYFYTQVYFRTSVIFLMTLFPPIIYAKDYESYPPILCTILLLLFFATLIYCKNIRFNSESVRNIKGFGQSAAAFLAMSLITALFVPKPDIDDRRSEFDEFTQGRFSSERGRLIDDFTDTSNGNNTSGALNDNPLYYAVSGEPLNLKTQCFYYYDDENDEWTMYREDKMLVDSKRYYTANNAYDEYVQDISGYDPAEFINEIVSVCRKHSDFAEKYNLTDLAEDGRTVESMEQIFECRLISADFVPPFILAPENTYNVSIEYCDADTEIIKSNTGVLYPYCERLSALFVMQPKNSVTIKYYSSALVSQREVRILLRALSYQDYDEFLKDLNEYSDAEVVDAVIDEYTAQNEIYEDECERVFSKKIRDLAEEITDGLYSDYEKAKAIEQYFEEEGYKYDIDYECPDGENINDFLFNEKRGSCYHYATAMVLMCRAVGLDARYCEGFAMTETVDSAYGAESGYQNYIIKESDSHAFPEVYISGYGWMRFEPTVSDVSRFSLGSIQLSAIIALILVLCIALAVIITIFIVPMLENAYLKKLAKKQECEKFCRYLICLIRKKLKLQDSISAWEIAGKAYEASNFSIYMLCDAFDRCIYGGYAIGSAEMLKMITIYKDFLYSLRKKRKSDRKEKRKNKKECVI